ncbi:MAG: DUF4336 domain-containing protein [Nannocystaceae bacterium]
MNERAPLRPLAPGLWEVERIVLGAGMRARVRMVVVALAGGGLWLHSPVAIDDALADALASLGEVREIVAPNRFHHLFAAAAKARYPAATLWGAPGLARKRPAIAFDRALEGGAQQPWPETLEAHLMGGRPTISEVVFHHRPSRTLICTDLLFNIRDEPHWLTRQLYRAIGSLGALGPNRVARLLTRDRRAAAASYRVLLGWPVARIVMAHGDVLEDRCEERLRAALEPLLAGT